MPTASPRLLGVKINPLTLADLLTVIGATIARQESRVIANVNAHALNLAHDLPWFRQFLNDCDYVFCDGFGVKWAARVLRMNLPARMTPPDWLPQVAALAVEEQWTIFLLGNRPGVAERAAEKLRRSNPGLAIVGCQHGYFDKTPGHPENEAVLQILAAARPNLLYIGFGMPQQERWIMENRARLPANVILPVGAMLDFVAGAVPRGPRWLTDHGFEWLTRLVSEPRRLWRRYLVGNVVFAARVLLQATGLRQ